MLTSMGSCFPGIAGIPVIKSLVIKVRMTTDRWHDGKCMLGSRSKCTGIKITGIWLMLPLAPDSSKIEVARWSACRRVLNTPLVRKVGVMSSIG